MTFLNLAEFQPSDFYNLSILLENGVASFFIKKQCIIFN